MTDGACYCDSDRPEFYITETRRARKQHRCTECGRAIQPGEHYEHVRGKWNGSIGTHKTCPRCLALRDWVQAHVPCFCWAHGNIEEDAIETAFEYAHEAPGLLFGARRRQVMIRRQPRPITQSSRAATVPMSGA